MSKKRKSPKKRIRKNKKKVIYRLRNWADYNESLVQRGSITFWIDDEITKAWYPEPVAQRKRGAPPKYSDCAIESMLTLRAVFHLTLRQTEGFVQSLFELMKLELDVPDYTTLSKRAVGLVVELPTSASEPIHIALDSTGLKIYGEGEWKVRQHGYARRRTWRKLHLGVDSATGEIQAVLLTEAHIDDAQAGKELLNQAQSPIKTVSADGSYDKRKMYQAITKHQIEQANIPPQRNARIWQHGNSSKPPLLRDQNLRYIRKFGRQRWKRDVGYHQRSLAETTIFRFKTIFSPYLASRKIAQQITEARIKARALNRMTQLGMPDSYPVI